MGNVVNAAFGGKPGYEEALFRQALREEIQENGGHLTHHAIKGAFVRTVEIAVVFEAEDPDILDQYVDITFALLEHEQAQTGKNWRP